MACAISSWLLGGNRRTASSALSKSLVIANNMPIAGQNERARTFQRQRRSLAQDDGARSIPCRGKAGIDQAPVFRQPRNCLHILVVEPDIERVEIGLLAFGPRRLRDRGNAVLVEQPFQRHLRRAGAMLAS